MINIKQWLFLRKLNKAIKEYGAKAGIGNDILWITMRGYSSGTNYNILKRRFKEENDLINHIIKEIRIRNIKEATETGIPI